MTDYTNIIKVLGTQNPQMDDLSRRTENYRIAEEASRNGTSLSDVMRRLDELEGKVKGIEASKAEVNKEVFETMEQAVRDAEPVREAREHLADVKSQIIYEYCMRDARYASAMSAYRDAVNAEYVRSREERKDA